MPVTVTKTKDAQPVGAYKPTEIDARKAEADFLLIQVGPSMIRWRHNGTTERVGERRLKTLQAQHPNWMTDF